MASFTATFSYVSVVCDGLGCNAVIRGRYFSCLDCSVSGRTNSFDLCIPCHLNGNYSHVHLHTTFVEKHVSAFPAANYQLAAYATLPQSLAMTLNYNNEVGMTGIEAENTTCSSNAHVNDVCCSIM